MINQLKKLKRTKEVIVALKRLSLSKDGEYILGYLLDICGYNKSSFVPGNPEHSAFLEGKRMVILEVLDLIKMDQVRIDKLIQTQILEDIQNVESTIQSSYEYTSSVSDSDTSNTATSR